MWAEIQNGRVGLLVLAVGVTCLTYVFRALRWQYLLHPLDNPPFSAVFKTTVIGFAVSRLLPARAGEMVNPGDLIVADLDGVVVVPKEHVDAVLKMATEIEVRAAEQARLIRETKSLREGLAKYGRI